MVKLIICVAGSNAYPIDCRHPIGGMVSTLWAYYLGWIGSFGMSAESELKLTDIFFPLLVNVLPLPSWVPGTPTVLSAVLSAVFPA